MASSRSLRIITVDGSYLPSKGEIVLGRCLEGSLASATSPSTTMRSTSSPLPSALVLSSRHVIHMQSLALEITCFAIPSYYRDENPVERVLQHPITKRFLPLPSSRHVPTPPQFGEPIRVGGYVNDRPCWVDLRELTILIDFGKRVSSRLHLDHCCLLMSILAQGV